MTKEEFKNILDICSRQEDVRNAVLKNHDNNLWWPLEVEDYRKRLIIAGLSTRISYNMVDTYKNVINNLNQYSFDEIKNMTKEEVIDIIKNLGLSNIRYKYIFSMINFIDKMKEEILNISNEELIDLIQENVSGASYKVAQCCVLYMKGYYCGIMPVDSGMKDVLLPCIGFKEYNNAIGHNILRKELEELVYGINLENIIKNNGYSSLSIPDYSNTTWWSHLVLIYFKRYYCNKHNPDKCPLKKFCKSKCKKNCANF